MTPNLLFRLFFFLIALSPFSSLATETMEITLPILSIERSKVSETDRAIAEKFFAKAKAAAAEKKGFEAMHWAIRTLEKNPDHETIRSILGFRLYEGRWRTGWEIGRLKQGFVDHPTFGWMPSDFAQRYESGERFVQKIGWIPAADDALLRTEIVNGWEIATEHYDLKTNHSLEEGVATARRLEHLYRAWKLLFFDFLYGEEALARAFHAAPSTLPTTTPPRHRVFLYRDKADYVACLQGVEPRIAVSNGYYYPKTRRAFFFPVSDSMDAREKEIVRKTIYHEGTHQLFQEARSAWKTMPGVRSNFWLVEGIAMFMETFRIERRDGNDCYVVGNLHDARLDAAKYHKTDENFYVPFGNIVRMGTLDFQSHPKLPKLYSQSAGMTHFLLFAEQGAYRNQVVKLLQMIYSGADRADSLAKLTGKTYHELDEHYDLFLQHIPIPE